MANPLQNVGNTANGYTVGAASFANVTTQKLQKLALGMFVILSAANMPSAEAGPFAGGVCLLACIPLIEAPPLLAICLSACGVAAIVPGP